MPAGNGRQGAHDESEMAVMSLGDHLEELRSRVIKCLLSLGAMFVISWIFRSQLLAVLMLPHVRAMRALDLDQALKFASYLEPIIAQLKACLFASAMLSAPVIIYQVWAFVAPGLFPHERRKVVGLGMACLACFLGGISFGYIFFVPLTLRVLFSMAGPTLEPVLMVSSYLSMFCLLTLALGVAFQTPVVIYFLIRWGVLTVEGLQKHRRAAILTAFIVSAIITPTVDPLTQTLMAVVLMMLYDLGGLAAAPTWASFKSFFTFTGPAILVGAAYVGWFTFWPVAHASALRGEAYIGGRLLPPGEVLGVQRGAVCRTAGGGAIRITLGREGERVVYLAGDAALQVNNAGRVNLLGGQSLATNRKAGAPLEVRSGGATAAVESGSAQLTAPDRETLAIAVLEGSVLVRSGGQERRIRAGQETVVRQGGEPADLSQVERRWQELLQGAPGGTPAPAH